MRQKFKELCIQADRKKGLIGLIEDCAEKEKTLDGHEGE